MENKKYWKDDDPLAGLYEKDMAFLRTLNTVEEVEKIHCNECSKNGHWGWCDGNWIICPYKWRIKEILGETAPRFTSLIEQMKTIGAPIK